MRAEYPLVTAADYLGRFGRFSRVNENKPGDSGEGLG
jgi:hypothetical protein